MLIFILFCPSTCEKSLTLFNILFATLGVPLDRFAISSNDSSSIVIPRMFADLIIIVLSSSTVYISNFEITPNLSLKGADKLPALVVAPTRVNFDKSNLIERAAGPFPIIISNAKSSIAEYRTSSTDLFNLCISSINNTSLSFKLVNIAAKSPAFSMEGPDVILMSTPSSLAIIFARVVFPSPGGP